MLLTRWKSPLRRVLGDTAANVLIEFSRIRFVLFGVLDLMHPERGGGPFNGQQARVALFESILAKSSPAIIVETGTYLGSTTEYLAATKLPVYSVESDRCAYGFAKARLWRRHNVHLKRGDSRAALQEWLDGPLHNHSSGPALFYLDAHWSSDLPLGEELAVIFDRCGDAIVMIDDFRVPFDSGSGYDDYGDGKVLVPAYIEPAVHSFRLRGFYPSTPSAEETGLRRGCIVLVKEASLIRDMEALPLLREAIPSSI